VRALTEETGFPLLAEAASQLRFTGTTSATAMPLIDGADWLYRLPAADREWLPDLILQLGAPPTSGVWERWLDRHPDIERVVVSPTGWPDPHSSASDVVHADVRATCEALALAVARSRAAGNAVTTDFAHTLAAANAQVREILDAHSRARDDALGEAGVARTVTQALPEGAWLVLGNSLPVRTVDAWCAGPLRDVRVLSQRGASGIDGLISGAAGAASVANAPVVLLVGDVSALHDIGGLALGKAVRTPLVVVVVNNDGGRIFEQLPVARGMSDDLLRHFTTPHGVDFEHAAGLYGHAFERVQTQSALDAALVAALARPGCTVIDAVVSPHGAAEEQARVLETLATARLGT
jgi:2-succinyl-5-enolpyruvyl-6-hydroxy-3-cyclohexene-1-carboxylate synthase